MRHLCTLPGSPANKLQVKPSVPASAGVPDVAAAQAVVDFAVRFELLGKQEAGRLRLVELNTSDAGALAASLPRFGHLLPSELMREARFDIFTLAVATAQIP